MIMHFRYAPALDRRPDAEEAYRKCMITAQGTGPRGQGTQSDAGRNVCSWSFAASTAPRLNGHA